MSYADLEYFRLLKDVYENGHKKKTRSGETISVFGKSMEFDLKKGLPLLTTKKMYAKGIIVELIWFLKGDTNIKYLVDNNVHIWDADAYRYYCELCDRHNKMSDENDFVEKKDVLSKDEFIKCVESCMYDTFSLGKNCYGYTYKKRYKYGDLGPVYGKQWRRFGEKNIDQIKNIIKTLKTNPDDRRMLCIAFNPDAIEDMALPPCHIMFQFYSSELSLDERNRLNGNNEVHMTDSELDDIGIPRRELSCSFYCRSQDVPLGTPYNIASYAILTHIIAKCVNMSVGRLVYNGGDCHIYTNQLEGVEEQLKNNPEKYEAPKLIIKKDILDIDNLSYDDFKIEGYESYPVIKFPLSVG